MNTLIDTDTSIAPANYTPSTLRQRISPGLALRIAPFRLRLKEVFGFDFPDDFFLFWQFYSQLPEKSLGGFSPALPLRLGNIFLGFEVETDVDTLDPLADPECANHPPEFVSIFYSLQHNKHWGYYFDDPDHKPDTCAVVMYDPDSRPNFEMVGFNLFEAVRQALEQSFAQYEIRQKSEQAPEELRYIAKQLERLSLMRAYIADYSTAERKEQGVQYLAGYQPKRTYTIPSRDGAGIVLPLMYYQPIVERDWLTEEGENYHPTTDMVDFWARKARHLAEQNLPGALLKLGKDLWHYPQFQDQASLMLLEAYQVLQRPILVNILRQRQQANTDNLLSTHRLHTLPPDTTTLSLVDAGIEVLAPEVCQLTALEELHLSFNNLTELPAEFGKLQQLRKLRLDLNLFERFPMVLTELTGLRELHLQDNYLHELPDELVLLQSLEYLNLDENHFLDFPRSIAKLTALRYLSLRGGYIQSLPAEIASLQQLEHLAWTSRRRIRHLAHEITHLPALRVLELGYLPEPEDNPAASWQIPAIIGELEHLEQLTLQSIAAPEWNEAITALSKLTRLTIQCKTLTEIPLPVFSLTALNTLIINDTALSSVPEYIVALTNLETLDLRNNKIENLSDEIIQLPRLRRVILKNNPLTVKKQLHLQALVPDVLWEF